MKRGKTRSAKCEDTSAAAKGDAASELEGGPKPEREGPKSGSQVGAENGSGESVDTPSVQLPLPAPTPPQLSEEVAPRQEDAQEAGSRLFPIVGIGASAGGLRALEEFFANMPSDSETGMAFIIVQHLDPDHKSILSELVRRYTRMQVFQVEDGMAVEPNCAYIIPPNKDLALMQGKLHLIEPTLRRGLRLPIDFLFSSLAQDRSEHAIGIILSGNGTDGTRGLRAIKEAGGMAIVQDPQSAEYDGMPRSAIAAGLADYVVAPADMPAQLLSYVKHASARTAPTAAGTSTSRAWAMKIMALLRSHTGHDFSNYKQNTIRRRVERRMAVNQIETFEHYIRLLRQNTAELDILFRELLIGVTGFFRDPPAFEALRELALAPLLADRAPSLPIRVWVPGCSTGEEAYSIAMLIQETADVLGRGLVVQIFATDIDQDSIEKARNGVYPGTIAADVSPERLSRFFTREDKDTYRVKKTMRDQLVFAVQDVIKDPPFSKLDLISCRNMLIYMEPVLQKRLLPLFHYALAPGGFLLLGNSESVGEFTNLFGVLERKWKLYRRREFAAGAAGGYPLPNLPLAGERYSGMETEIRERKPGLRETMERLLLRDHTPAAALVNGQGEILYVHGRSGKYLEFPQGEATLNLVRAAREGLKIELADALRKLASDGDPIRYDGLEVRTDGGFQKVRVTLRLADGQTGTSNLILVTFEELIKAEVEPTEAHVFPSPGTDDSRPAGSVSDEDRRISDLERELRVKSETLQTTIEELETSNEEIKSTNEELQSTNEELQSTNEELETSKEELQSVNEELITVNTELQQKMDVLTRVNNDMSNVLAGTGIGMLFVDHSLRIQRFTPAMTKIISLIQSDVGRPVSDLVSNLAGYQRLGADVKAVLETLSSARSTAPRCSGSFSIRIPSFRKRTSA